MVFASAGYCFIKYATSEDADRAIHALHKKYTFPGGVGPIQVKYADGERERLGLAEYKLYVGSLNKQATEEEVEQIFSRFGRVDDVYILRNRMNQSRGSAFVKFLNREEATAAIHALNDKYTMRGCENSLVVEFAYPKRPGPGENLSQAVTSGTVGLPDQGQLQAPNCGGQTSFSQGFPLQPMLGFSGLLPLQQAHTYAQTAMMNQYHLPAQQHMMNPLHQSASYQSSQQAFSQLQQQLQLMQSSNPNLTPQQSTTLAGSVPQTSATFGYPTIKPVTDSLYAGSVAPVVFSAGGPVKCNWTEHISLDGYRYYYNSTTGESKWERPEELALFELQQKQHEAPLIQQSQSQTNSQSYLQMQMQPQGQHPQLLQHGTQSSAGYGYTQMPVAGGSMTTSMSDSSRFQQGLQGGQDWMWKNETTGPEN